MNKIGFVVKVKSKGKQYYYLRKSERIKGVKNKKKDSNIFSFGSKENALDKLYEWKTNIEKMPSELINLNYGYDDILKWIEKVESD